MPHIRNDSLAIGTGNVVQPGVIDGTKNVVKWAPILSVEDEESDRLILGWLHKESGIPNPLVFAFDGQAAADYLAGNSPYHDRDVHPLPGLVLLDLKMPRMDGFDFLRWLARLSEFQNLPVVILSSSRNRPTFKRPVKWAHGTTS